MPSKAGTGARERLLSGSRPSYGKGLSGGRTDVSVWERAITFNIALERPTVLSVLPFGP